MTVGAIGHSARKTGWAPRHAAAPARSEIGSLAVALALIAVLTPLQRWWTAQVLLMLLLLSAPGVVLLRALQIPGTVVSSFPVYVPCASIVVMFGSGLAVDTIGPALGVAAPLRTVPLLIGLEVMCLVLLGISAKARPGLVIDWWPLVRSSRHAWPLVVPLVAAAGALRLNGNHGNDVALSAMALFAVLLIITSALSPHFDTILLRISLYAGSLALSWSYSLRGDSVYGFDISTEYQRLQETIITGVWHANHINDAYGAMLSVTVMPTELHALSGISGLLVLKVIYPMIFAFFPVALFDLARKIIRLKWAFTAAVFLIFQFAFTEIVSVARQEIALLFFIALIAAMTESGLRRRPQYLLITLLALVMVLSHYSTTYVAITVIGLALPLQWATSWFRDIPRVTGAVAVAFASALIGAAVWYVPITHSNSHLLQVAQTVQAQGLNLLPNRAAGSSIISAYLQGNTEKPISAAQYEHQIYHFYQFNKPNIIPLATAKSARYALRDAAVPKAAVRWPHVHSALGLGLLLIEQLANVLAAIGGLFMALRRNVSPLVRQIGLISLGTTLLLTLIRFSGTLAGAYGQERAQLQGMVLLAVTLCSMLQSLDERRGTSHPYVFRVTVACLALTVFNTSYLVNSMLGGGVSANLANSGPAYEYFDVSAPEISAAQWLGTAFRPGQLVYADEYGQLPLVAATGIQSGLMIDVTPLTINRSAWVYASRTNVVNGRAFALFDGLFVTYAFPLGFLDENYDLVYTNDSSEVFYR